MSGNRMRLIGLGAGGHAKVVIDLLQSLGHEVVGLVDPNPELWKTRVCGVEVLGRDEELKKIRAEGVSQAFIGVGSTGDSRPRRILFERAAGLGFALPCVIHGAAVISESVGIGEGTQVMAGAIINAATVIGDNVIINTGAVVEHDCRIANDAHIAPGAVLGGDVEVGEGAHVGIGAVVKQGIRIGARAIVGAGAVVVRDVAAGAVVAGVPARPL